MLGRRRRDCFQPPARKLASRARDVLRLHALSPPAAGRSCSNDPTLPRRRAAYDANTLTDSLHGALAGWAPQPEQRVRHGPENACTALKRENGDKCRTFVPSSEVGTRLPRARRRATTSCHTPRTGTAGVEATKEAPAQRQPSALRSDQTVPKAGRRGGTSGRSPARSSPSRAPSTSARPRRRAYRQTGTSSRYDCARGDVGHRRRYRPTARRNERCDGSRPLQYAADRHLRDPQQGPQSGGTSVTIGRPRLRAGGGTTINLPTRPGHVGHCTSTSVCTALSPPHGTAPHGGRQVKVLLRQVRKPFPRQFTYF